MRNYITIAEEEFDKISKMISSGYSKTAIAKNVGCTTKTLMKVFEKMNISYDYYEKKEKSVITCKNCTSNIPRQNRSGYCKDCYPSIRSKKYVDDKFKKWIETGDMGNDISTTVRGNYRKRLLEFYGDECSICGMGSSWNGKNRVLVLDHIDGDASNNNSANIRFVCPNCDSQLDTFKSKNKKSARSFRRNK